MDSGVEGNLVEIFDSIQGESSMVGYRQLFLRLGGCNLDCEYCDTPQARREVPRCRVEIADTRMDLDNPLTVGRLLELLQSMVERYHHSLVITGGEPMMQAGFLMELLPRLRRGGHRLFLETNATMPEEMGELAPNLEWVAADIKLSSCTGEPDRFEANREFLQLCDSPEIIVKIVVTCGIDREEFATAVEMVAEVDEEATLVIQPVTMLEAASRVPPRVLLELQEMAAGLVRDVRVIPQVHPLLGIR